MAETPAPQSSLEHSPSLEDQQQLLLQTQIGGLIARHEDDPQLADPLAAFQSRLAAHDWRFEGMSLRGEAAPGGALPVFNRLLADATAYYNPSQGESAYTQLQKDLAGFTDPEMRAAYVRARMGDFHIDTSLQDLQVSSEIMLKLWEQDLAADPSLEENPALRMMVDKLRANLKFANDVQQKIGRLLLQEESTETSTFTVSQQTIEDRDRTIEELQGKIAELQSRASNEIDPEEVQILRNQIANLENGINVANQRNSKYRLEIDRLREELGRATVNNTALMEQIKSFQPTEAVIQPSEKGTNAEQAGKERPKYQSFAATNQGPRGSDMDAVFASSTGLDGGGKSIVSNFGIDSGKVLKDLQQAINNGVIGSVDVLCDGIGGIPQSEAASAAAATIFVDELLKEVSGQEGRRMDYHIRKALSNTASLLINKKIPGDTNFVASVIDRQGKVWIASIGDAHAYLVQPMPGNTDWQPRLLSHNPTERSLADGKDMYTTTEEGEKKKIKPIDSFDGLVFHDSISDAIIGGYDLSITENAPLNPGEMVVLCSDGVHEGYHNYIDYRTSEPRYVGPLVRLAEKYGSIAVATDNEEKWRRIISAHGDLFKLTLGKPQRTDDDLIDLSVLVQKLTHRDISQATRDNASAVVVSPEPEPYKMNNESRHFLPEGRFAPRRDIILGEGARVSLVNPTPELLERFNIEGSDVLMVLQRREKITHIGKSPMSLDNIENAKLPFGSAIVLLDNDLDDISEQVKAIVEKDRMYPQFRAQVYKNITDIVPGSVIDSKVIGFQYEVPPDVKSDSPKRETAYMTKVKAQIGHASENATTEMYLLFELTGDNFQSPQAVEPLALWDGKSQEIAIKGKRVKIGK